MMIRKNLFRGDVDPAGSQRREEVPGSPMPAKASTRWPVSAATDAGSGTTRAGSTGLCREVTTAATVLAGVPSPPRSSRRCARIAAPAARARDLRETAGRCRARGRHR